MNKDAPKKSGPAPAEAKVEAINYGKPFSQAAKEREAIKPEAPMPDDYPVRSRAKR